MDYIDDYIKMKHFIATMTITASVLLAVLGFMLSAIAETERKIDATRMEYIKIEARLAEIQTDIIWIKREVNNR